MISKNESEITNTWLSQNKDIMVSIRCLTYNHEKHIAQCLDGFLMQVTNFPFEVIVHDDASTDSTSKIILEYQNRFPNIIKPIVEEENLFSKHDGSLSRAVDSNIKGKYVALCEGDDVWIDEFKLQRQYDFIVAHQDCSLVLHNTLIHDLKNKNKDSYFNSWNSIHVLSPRDVFFDWKVHTSSYFFPIKIYRYIAKQQNDLQYWFGDYKFLTWALFLGKVYCLPEVMSQYNAHNEQGITYKVSELKDERLANKIYARAQYLIEYDKLTNYIYHNYVQERVEDVTFQYYSCLGNYKELLKAKNRAVLIRQPVRIQLKVLIKAYFPSLIRIYRQLFVH